jgi:hypothetical protein
MSSSSGCLVRSPVAWPVAAAFALSVVIFYLVASTETSKGEPICCEWGSPGLHPVLMVGRAMQSVQPCLVTLNLRWAPSQCKPTLPHQLRCGPMDVVSNFPLGATDGTPPAWLAH